MKLVSTLLLTFFTLFHCTSAQITTVKRTLTSETWWDHFGPDILNGTLGGIVTFIFFMLGVRYERKKEAKQNESKDVENIRHLIKNIESTINSAKLVHGHLDTFTTKLKERPDFMPVLELSPRLPFTQLSNTPENIMPMTIGKLGNSTVATIPTLYNHIIKGAIDGHEFLKGDVILFVSVGAVMNISAFTYKV